MIIFNYFRVISLMCLVSCSAVAVSGYKKTTSHVKNSHKKTKSNGLLHTLDALKVSELYFNTQGPFAEVNQGVVKASPFKNLVRTCKVYEHFITRAIFDVVKLGEKEVQQLADLRAATRGHGKEERDLFVMQELNNLAAYDVFYLLADVRSADHPYLTDTHSAWKMFLQNKETGQNIVPGKIFEVDLEPETRMLFGSDWKNISALKVAYRVEFPRGQEKMGTQKSLVFSAPDLQTSLTF